MKDEIKKRADAIGKEAAYPCTTANNAADACVGLTKLELFAMNAMNGIISGDSKGEFSTTSVCQSAVIYARELCLALAESEKEASNG